MLSLGSYPTMALLVPSHRLPPRKTSRYRFTLVLSISSQMSAVPTHREADVHPPQGGGYVPPNASQPGYYQRVFHPHQPVYTDNTFPSQGYDPRFQTSLDSHATGSVQHGYSPTIDQSGRQQESQYPPHHIQHPTHFSHPHPHSQSMNHDLPCVNEPLTNEGETVVQGGKKAGKRRAVNQAPEPAPKKAKQTPATSGETTNGTSLRIPK